MIATRMLVTVKVAHTAVWAFFVSCIALIPVAAATRHFLWAEILTAFMFLECAILACNRGRCPLTDLASRYTDDRSANFDIYLPEWLARNNQAIFGSLFVADIVILAWQLLL